MLPYRLYPLSRLEKRNRTKYIMLVHIPNFLNVDYYYPADLKERTTYYYYDKFKEYYLSSMPNKHLPFHYYVYNIAGDWDISIGAPLDYKSPWIKGLIDNEYIPYAFDDAIIIAVQDNFHINIPDDFFIKKLGYSLIEPLCREYKLRYQDSFFTFDEVFNFDKFNKDIERGRNTMDYRFIVEPMTFFDKIILNIDTLKYI